eukprot:scaffold1112_cov116-Isochrysis_galbana.AAC.47
MGGKRLRSMVEVSACSCLLWSKSESTSNGFDCQIPCPAEYGRRRLAARSAASAYDLIRKVSVGPRGERIRRR